MGRARIHVGETVTHKPVVIFTRAITALVPWHVDSATRTVVHLVGGTTVTVNATVKTLERLIDEAEKEARA